MWSNNCASCHGKAAGGVEGSAKSLLGRQWADPKFDRQFFDAIMGGAPNLKDHSFSEKLGDKACWAMVNHLREMQENDRRNRGDVAKPQGGVYSSQHHKYRVETVIGDGIQNPWSVDFLPGGRMLVTEKAGRLRIHSTGKTGGTLSDPVKGTPAVRDRGQGGLMDVAPHPDFAQNGWIYLAFSDPNDRKAMTKIVRGKIAEAAGITSWTNEETIFQAKPEHYVGGDLHFGCRIVFQKADQNRYYVFFGIGERGLGDMAQDRRRPNGKVHRVWDDGKIPEDNPFVSEADSYASIWSYGHRNPQGLTFDLSGQLWDTEHGPRGGDELNLVARGANYGWPEVSFGINYGGDPFRLPWAENNKAKDGATITMPVYRWLPSIAACGLDVARGDLFPKWKGDLFAGGLAGSVVDRIRITDGKVAEREEIINGLGRVRDVVTGTDGSIYVVLNGPDRVIRIVPAN